ncbi:hypothetical protein ACSV5G_13730 [Agrobacterium cavarae]|uniref:hypothetical protein n=1 Tax=Agrobacterium cavarae TaxID=2528239 RepID=UPI000DE13452|nr:hypothetical protein [Agrobacterium cavarae]
MNLYVIGDSHAAYCFENIVETKICWLGPVTMNRLARDGLHFFEKVFNGFSSEDWIVFVVGEIDVRCHLLSVSVKEGRDLEDIAGELARSFVGRVADYSVSKDFKAAVCQPMFPANRRPNPELPFVGTISERLRAHKILSEKLFIECERKGIPFLRLPEKFRGKDGLLRRKYSDDGVHIVPCEASSLIKPLYAATNKKLSFRYDFLTVLNRRFRYYAGRSLKRKGLPKSRPLDLFN